MSVSVTFADGMPIWALASSGPALPAQADHRRRAEAHPRNPRFGAGLCL